VRKNLKYPSGKAPQITSSSARALVSLACLAAGAPLGVVYRPPHFDSPFLPNNNTKMKLALSLALAGSAAAYTAPTMTFSLGKKKAAPTAVRKVS